MNGVKFIRENGGLGRTQEGTDFISGLIIYGERAGPQTPSNIAAMQMRSINLQMGLGAILARIQASGIRSVAIAFGQATLGATAFQIALDALGIGLILLAIAGLIAGLKYLYENSRKFREILGGIGGAGKEIFHNIGVYAGRLWGMVNPLLRLIGTYTNGYFPKFGKLPKWLGMASLRRFLGRGTL